MWWVHIHIYTYTHTMEYYSAVRKKNILPFVTTWMKPEDIMLSEISQTKKDKYCVISLNVESKKYNKLVNITKKKQTHRYREQTSGYQWGEGSGEEIGRASCRERV